MESNATCVSPFPFFVPPFVNRDPPPRFFLPTVLIPILPIPFFIIRFYETLTRSSDYFSMPTANPSLWDGPPATPEIPPPKAPFTGSWPTCIRGSPLTPSPPSLFFTRPHSWTGPTIRLLFSRVSTPSWETSIFVLFFGVSISSNWPSRISQTRNSQQNESFLSLPPPPFWPPNPRKFKDFHSESIGLTRKPYEDDTSHPLLLLIHLVFYHTSRLALNANQRIRFRTRQRSFFLLLPLSHPTYYHPWPLTVCLIFLCRPTFPW